MQLSTFVWHQVDLKSEEALRSLLESFRISLPPSHYLVVIIKRYIQVTKTALDPIKCDLRRILYHHSTSWLLNNWRTRAGIISKLPLLFCFVYNCGLWSEVAPLNPSKFAFRTPTEFWTLSWRFNFDVSSYCTTFLACVLSWRNSNKAVEIFLFFVLGWSGQCGWVG